MRLVEHRGLDVCSHKVVYVNKHLHIHAPSTPQRYKGKTKIRRQREWCAEPKEARKFRKEKENKVFPHAADFQMR